MQDRFVHQLLPIMLVPRAIQSIFIKPDAVKFFCQVDQFRDTALCPVTGWRSLNGHSLSNISPARSPVQFSPTSHPSGRSPSWKVETISLRACVSIVLHFIPAPGWLAPIIISRRRRKVILGIARHAGMPR